VKREYDFGIRTDEGNDVIGVEVKSGQRFKFDEGQQEFDNEVMKGNFVQGTGRSKGLQVVDVLYIFVPS
jgi:hypothetical protein